MVTALGNQEIGTLQGPPMETSTGSTVISRCQMCTFGWTELPDYWDLLILDPAPGGTRGASVVVARTGQAPPRTSTTCPLRSPPDSPGSDGTQRRRARRSLAARF